jgi:hypothetical protein
VPGVPGFDYVYRVWELIGDGMIEKFFYTDEFFIGEDNQRNPLYKECNMSARKLLEEMSNVRVALENYTKAIVDYVEALKKAPAKDAAEPDDEDPTPAASDKNPKKGKKNRKVFTAAEPPGNAEEQKLFRAQWKDLGNKKKQDAYTEGKIDSLGKALPGAEEEPEETPADEENFETEPEASDENEDFNAEEEPADDDTPPAVTFEDVSKAANELKAAKGRDAVLKLMAHKDYQLKALSALPEDKYEAFITDLKKATKAKK